VAAMIFVWGSDRSARLSSFLYCNWMACVWIQDSTHCSVQFRTAHTWVKI